MRILAATAGELERDFPFGTTIQLFEPLWLASTTQERESVMTGPAQLASRLLTTANSGEAPELDGQEYPVIRGLFGVLQELVWGDPDEPGVGALAILVDDVHMADPWSLRFLAYLTERMADLPIALILALRPGEPCADPVALATLRRAARGPVVRPSPLGIDGVALVVQRDFPEADEAFLASCARVTGGNPFLLVELLEELRIDECVPEAMTAQQLLAPAPKRVRDRLTERLAAMSDVQQEVGNAVSLFDDGASVRQVSRLAGVDSQAVLRAAEALAAVNLLRPGVPLSFKYPLERAAVAQSLSALKRGEGHRRAASVLIEDHAPAAEIAGHLIKAPPEESVAAIAALREAATEALTSGSAQRAIQLLERALAEGPGSDQRVDLLAELGHAEAQAGLPDASERLNAARKISEHPRRRAELALAEGQALYAHGRFRAAATVLDAGLAELGPDDRGLAQELTGTYVSAAYRVAELQPHAVQLREQMIASAPSAAQRSAIAHTTILDSLRGAPRDAVTGLADLAWAGGGPVAVDPPAGSGWPQLAAALLLVDELEWTLEICDAVLAAPSPGQPPAQRALAGCCRAWALYEQGAVAQAQAQAQDALETAPKDPRDYGWSALAVSACCHIESGSLEQAEAAITTLRRQIIRESPIYPLLLEIRARLRLAQHRPREALQDAVQAGVILDTGFPETTPGAIPWRSTAALADLALGEPKRARVLVEEELETTRRIGVTRIVIRDLRILGLALGGTKGLDLLHQAVDAGAAYPSRLEHVRALVDLGAGLRRANRRTDAREPLRTGLDLSSKGGADVLADRAQTELIATGARPRRQASSGLESLTASQRRVTGLAVQGLTTRQMADTLFVTPKTIEYHLRQTYQKLDVTSRQELADVVGTPIPPARLMRVLKAKGGFPGAKSEPAT